MNTEQLLLVLYDALPYVYWAYECAFPDYPENVRVAYNIEREIVLRCGEFPEGKPRFFGKPEYDEAYGGFVVA